LTRFPDQLADRLAGTIARTHRLVTSAHQRLNTVTSALSALQPGEWQPLTLAAGWTNLTDYVPGQARVHQVGVGHVVAHLTGGTCADGTIIGTLPDGLYNPTHLHVFGVNAITGANAVPQAGTLADLAGDLNSGVTTCTPAAGILGPSPTTTQIVSYCNAVGSLLNGGLTVGTGLVLHHGTTSTPVNLNTPTITVDTSGNMIINNVNPAVTQLSFSEFLPLVTD
jgi:hypothetical protein